MTDAVADPDLERLYLESEQEYLRSLPLEHFMESTAQATQREITVASFRVIRASRPDVQCFNELLVQYPRAGTDRPGRVVPDNMVVVHPEPIRAAGSFVVPRQPARPFMVMEYASKTTLRKDYEANMYRYERSLGVPYYLLSQPEHAELTLYRLVDGSYSAVPPDTAGRAAVPELELTVGERDGWVRYWFRGELVPVTDDLVRERDAERAARRAAERLTAKAEQVADAERAARQALEAEVARLRAELAAKG